MTFPIPFSREVFISNLQEWLEIAIAGPLQKARNKVVVHKAGEKGAIISINESYLGMTIAIPPMNQCRKSFPFKLESVPDPDAKEFANLAELLHFIAFQFYLMGLEVHEVDQNTLIITDGRGTTHALVFI